VLMMIAILTLAMMGLPWLPIDTKDK